MTEPAAADTKPTQPRTVGIALIVIAVQAGFTLISGALCWGFTPQFQQLLITANGKAGEYMTAIDPDGKEVHRDIILVSDPPRRLAYAWRPLYDEFKHERPSRVTIDISAAVIKQ